MKSRCLVASKIFFFSKHYWNNTSFKSFLTTAYSRQICQDTSISKCFNPHSSNSKSPNENKKSFELNTQPNIKIFRFKACPFCCGVTTVLDFLKFNYQTIEVNPVTKKEIKCNPVLSKSYIRVPIALIDDEKQINESKEIIKYLSELKKNITGESCMTSEINEDINWAYEKFVVLFPPNIFGTFKESFQASRLIIAHKDLSAKSTLFFRIASSIAMRLLKKKLKKKYNIKDERKALLDACDEWIERLRIRSTGELKPTIAEALVFGQFRSMREMDTFTYILSRKKEFNEWYKRMEKIVEAV